jgi:hypothetical protein
MVDAASYTTDMWVLCLGVNRPGREGGYYNYVVSKLSLLMVTTPFLPYKSMAWLLYNPSYKFTSKDVK